ncbi:hypothetical protein [Pontiella sp.]|uniref:hypothetical protein n=1 Tax=Pontiella sp. TaxID=2837462 RepID=UPI00356B41B8
MEMVKRLLFLLYVLLFVVYLFSCVIALARRGVGEIILACCSLVVLAGLRHVGYRWLDFERLCHSFPAGCARDRIPRDIRAEVELLVHEFHAPGTEWTRRVAIRHRLVELENEVPEIVDAYEEDLKCVLAV